MKTIGEEAAKLLKKIFNKQHPILADMILNWGSIVGIKYSNNSYPIKISYSKDEKGNKIQVLFIGASNSSVSMELAFLQDVLIERIAVYFGYKAIGKIIIKIQD